MARTKNWKELLDDDVYGEKLVPREIAPFFGITPYNVNLWERDGFDPGFQLYHSGQKGKAVWCFKQDLINFFARKEV